MNNCERDLSMGMLKRAQTTLPMFRKLFLKRAFYCSDLSFIVVNNFAIVAADGYILSAVLLFNTFHWGFYCNVMVF